MYPLCVSMATAPRMANQSQKVVISQGTMTTKYGKPWMSNSTQCECAAANPMGAGYSWWT